MVELIINQDLHENYQVKKALLISAYQGNQQKAICEEHLSELALLVQTYGKETVAQGGLPDKKV